MCIRDSVRTIPAVVGGAPPNRSIATSTSGRAGVATSDQCRHSHQRPHAPASPRGPTTAVFGMSAWDQPPMRPLRRQRRPPCRRRRRAMRQRRGIVATPSSSFAADVTPSNRLGPLCIIPSCCLRTKRYRQLIVILFDSRCSQRHLEASRFRRFDASRRCEHIGEPFEDKSEDLVSKLARAFS